MGFADPDQLEQLAGQIEGKAADVRADCTTFRTNVQAVVWQSAKAAEYRARCAALRQDLLDDADALDEAAAALRRHAAKVRARIEWAEDMVRQLQDLAENGADWTVEQLSEAKQAILDAGGEMVDDIEDIAGGISDLAGELGGAIADGLSDLGGKIKDGIGAVIPG